MSNKHMSSHVYYNVIDNKCGVFFPNHSTIDVGYRQSQACGFHGLGEALESGVI